MKRKHEEIARSELEGLVEHLFPCTNVEWEEVPQELEPPDWFVTIGEDRYAVEATTVIEPIDTSNATLSAWGISVALSRLIEEIEGEAKEKGILSGAYVIFLCPVLNLAKTRSQIKQFALDYIRATQDLPSAPEKAFSLADDCTLSIKKLHCESQYVAEVIGYKVKPEWESRTEIVRLLAQTLAEKDIKLRNIAEPVILLILDAYYYAEASDWVEAISSISVPSRFECICRIAPFAQSTIIWAKSSRWMGQIRG